MPTDLDLEQELRRSLRERADAAPPARHDLASHTRLRYRRERRQRAAVASAALVVAMVAVTVPMLAHVLAPARSSVAAPAGSLYDVPARGSLADDGNWLADVAELPWTGLVHSGDGPQPEPGTLRVAFADDVPGARVALVLGRTGDRVVFAWFTGPAGADATRMSLAAAPDDVPADDAVALVDTSDVASGRGLLVVVAEPGTELAYSPGVTIDATASGVREWTALDAADGVAATEAPVPGGWPAEAQVRLLQDGDVVGSVRPVISERTLFMATPAVAVEDPRGLRGVVDDSLVRTGADSILGQYGVPFDQVKPVLLAAGRLTDAGATEVALVGTTLPSGATVAWMVTLSSDGTGTGGSATPTIAGPAGTALLDRVFAVPVLGSLVVSAPAAGSSVEVLDGEGRSVAAFPLVSGGGTGPAPDTAASVRVLSADEQVVATAPLTRLAE